MVKICKKDNFLMCSDETTFHLSGQQCEDLGFKNRSQIKYTKNSPKRNVLWVTCEGVMALILVEQKSELWFMSQLKQDMVVLQ
jgi:hypothetical protein